MAKNQTRTVELQIKLQGAQSINELEQVTQEINTELKDLDKNSAAFKNMSNLAGEANASLREVDASLEGITSVEKAESAAKFSEGLVGGFQAAAGASLLFGEKTGKAMQEAQAKVVALFAITDGLKKLTEGFSAKNIAGLKAIAKGWKESAIATKLFGTAAKTALSAIGIGLILIAIAAIISNFDKLKAAWVKNSEKIKQALKFVALPLYLIIELIEKIKDKFGSLGNLIKSVGAGLKSLFRGDNFTEGLDDALVKLKAIDAVQEDLNELQTEVKETLEDTNEELSIYGDKQEEIFENQIKYNKKLVADFKKLIKLGEDLTDEQKEQLHDAEQAIKLDGIKLDLKRKETAENQKQLTLATLQKEIDDKRKIAELELNAAREVLAVKLQQKQYEINQILIESESHLRSMGIIDDTINYKLQDAIYGRESEKSIIEESLAIDKFRVEVIEEYIEGLNELGTAATKVKPPTEGSKKLQDILTRISNEYAYQRDLIKETSKFIDDYTKENEKNRGIILNINEEENKKLITLQAQKKVEEEKAKLLTAQIGEELLNNDKNIETNDKLIAKYGKINEFNEKRHKDIVQYNLDTGEVIGGLVQQLELEKDIALEKLNQANAAGDLDAVNIAGKESVRIANEIKDLYKEANGLTEENQKIKKTINNLELNSNAYLAENAKITNELKHANDGIVQVQQQQNKIIADNAQVYVNKWQKATALVKNFFKNNGQDMIDSLGAYQDALNQTFELLAAQDERRAEMAARELEKYIEDNKEKFDSDIKFEEDRADEFNKIKADAAGDEAALNDLLADAEGERYQDILAQIEAKKVVQADADTSALAAQAEADRIDKEYNQNILKREYAIEVAEYNAAKHRKAAAIVDALIQTTLAVIEALPNVFLSVAVGLLGAAGVATIATQALPPKPEKPKGFAKGTGEDGISKSQWAVVGEEGAELAYLPQNTRIYPNQQSKDMLSMFTGMNKIKGFAEGIGNAVIPTNTTQAQGYDYDMQAQAFITALKVNPMFVSWVEWRDINTKARFVQSRSGFGK